jgi:hypothetical protein
LTFSFETQYHASMRVKRNQVEEAISGMSDHGGQAPSVELRTKLKRLLETDRNLGRNARSTDPERANFAFFSAEAPGSGVEVQFSEYEAFGQCHGNLDSSAVRRRLASSDETDIV